MTVPGISVLSLMTWNVELFMLEAFMSWLNVALKAVPIDTFMAPFAGIVEPIVGTGALIVVKFHK